MVFLHFPSVSWLSLSPDVVALRRKGQMTCVSCVSCVLVKVGKRRVGITVFSEESSGEEDGWLLCNFRGLFISFKKVSAAFSDYIQLKKDSDSFRLSKLRA